MPEVSHPPSASALKRRSDCRTPAEARTAFLTALRVGDRRAAVAGLARDACFVTPDSTVIRGRIDIARILAQLDIMGMELDAEDRGSALIAGDTAFCSERWTVRSRTEGSERLVQAFLSQSVSIRIEDQWKLSIVAPWGWGGET